MATIINTPSSQSPRSDNGMGFLLGVIVLIIFLVLIVYYGVPALKSSSSPQINVPGKIDVNVNNPGSGGSAPSGK